MGHQHQQKEELFALQRSVGIEFPGCNYYPRDRKRWMADLDPERVHINQIVWPGTHNSATNEIGATINPHPNPVLSTVGVLTDPLSLDATRSYLECQNESVYSQLSKGVRALDVGVGENRCVKYLAYQNYPFHVVIDHVKDFLSETTSEIIILKIHTEQGHDDPPEFENFLVEKLGDYLICQDDGVFNKTIAELLPKRVICVWIPKSSGQTSFSNKLWNPRYFKEDWDDTSLPRIKFNHNLNVLRGFEDASKRKNFVTIQNTLKHQTPDIINYSFSFFPKFISSSISPYFGANMENTVRNVNELISPFARLFISQAFSQGLGGRLQIFSTDLFKEDFVDACVGMTYGRVHGKTRAEK